MAYRTIEHRDLLSAGEAMERNERLETLAHHIESLPPERFNMDSWFFHENGGEANGNDVMRQGARDFLGEDCGTAACIAGWTLALFGPSQLPDPDNRRFVSREAAELLHLDSSERSDLFTEEARFNVDNLQDIGPELAADVIREYKVTEVSD